jgi:N-acetylglucosaminyldiphosphoundecaprenol N-acetyl-beta-D-mannosaminyltransferase
VNALQRNSSIPVSLGNRERVEILGIPVDRLTLQELLEAAVALVRKGGNSVIMYLNVHVANQVHRDSALKEIFKKADIVYCDGGGIKFGARLLGEYLPERMTGADWIYELCARCEKEHISLFFLGGEPDVARRATDKLRVRYPDLHISGCHHGYFDRSRSSDVIDQINRSRTDILFVGFGTPMQELWLDEHRPQIRVPLCWAVGALVDFVSGEVRRGPRWMLDNNLEWLFRLVLEPKRMWRRYLIGNARFLAAVLLQRVRAVMISGRQGGSMTGTPPDTDEG